MYSCNAFKHENANNHKTRFDFNIFGAYRFFHHNKCHIINHVASKAWMNVLHQYYLDQGSEVERWGSREPKPNKESQQDGPVSKISPAAQVKTGDRSLSLMVNVQDGFLVLMVYWQHIIAEMVMYTTHMAILCLMGFL